MIKKSFVALIIILTFCLSSLHAIEVASVSPDEEILWTFETTSGMQNLRNIPVIDNREKKVSQLLNFKGILFNSYHDKIQFLKSQLNLGFAAKTKFLWTDLPDFVHENHLSQELRCIEFDMQAMLPLRFKYDFGISPYIGYSFFNYSYNENFSGINAQTYKYSSFHLGFRFQTMVTKAFINTYNFSYSPLVFENTKYSPIQFINYGIEIRTNTHPLSLTFFGSRKQAWQLRKSVIFKGTKTNFDNSILGFALHLNLR